MPRLGTRSTATRMNLLRAALAVATDYGVKGVTHRRVAAEAGVALGSASYHYETIDDLMFEAFSWWTQTRTAVFTPAFTAAETDDDVVAAVLNLLSVMHGSADGRILLFEIYAQTVREPAYFKLVEEWSRTARANLERLYTARTAQQLEAVWEGVGVQFVMGAIDSLDETEPLIRLVLSQEPAGSKVGSARVGCPGAAAGAPGRVGTAT